MALSTQPSPAQVFMGPGDLRAGRVCDECAALGILLVMGPDALESLWRYLTRNRT